MWSASSKLLWSKIALNRWVATDNLWNRKALSLSRHLTGWRSFSRDPSKTDKLSHEWTKRLHCNWLEDTQVYPPNQNIWRFWAQPHVPLLRRPPLPLLRHMNQPQYIRPWRPRPEVCLPSKDQCEAVRQLLLLLLLLILLLYHVGIFLWSLRSLRRSSDRTMNSLPSVAWSVDHRRTPQLTQYADGVLCWRGGWSGGESRDTDKSCTLLHALLRTTMMTVLCVVTMRPPSQPRGSIRAVLSTIMLVSLSCLILAYNVIVTLIISGKQ